MKREAAPSTVLDARALKAWPLPEIADDADKEERGAILVVAGSREIPGAALLAATAALRAGAGKLVIATAASVASGMALAMPEARVIALPETAAGGLGVEGLARLQDVAPGCAAAVVGPGLMDEEGSGEFVAGLLPWLAHCTVVLDALAMDAAGRTSPFAQPVLLTPHAGEMAHLSGRGKKEIAADPQRAALDAALGWNAVVALKGATTVIATPDGRLWTHRAGEAGLATSGSGDTLAGIIGGLAARGATPEQACAWGIVLHATAGARLASAGPLGFLARELPAEVPAALLELSR
ncbi:NAD(P)H-hydrate dehydratase [Caenimonas terrae]|uniref:ADP-dependent (S)-NAD(P)H-hydrate dehydratase n=1 Tax=Caenimonas terrae TaxID=696074 RepID=A0ABW0NKZ4_9BURK